MRIEGTFYFDPNDRIYADHFPGRAVVPGSLIVHAFVGEGKKAGCGTEEWVIENFRFRELIAPGSYDFHIKPLKGGLKCLLYHEGRTVVSGILRNAKQNA